MQGLVAPGLPGMLYRAVTFSLLAVRTGCLSRVPAAVGVAGMARALCFPFSMLFAMPVFFRGWRP